VQASANKKDFSQIFHSMLRDLKRPLVVMAREAELEKSSPITDTLDSIQHTAEQTLKLVDSYLLMARSEYGQTALPLESVSIGAVIYDVAQQIKPAAKKACVDIACDVSDGNVMANPEGLQAMIWCLSDMVVAQASTHTGSIGSSITINSRENAQFIRVSVLSKTMEVKNSDIDRARRNQGRAHQALSLASPDSGIRLAVADMLSSALGTNLTAVRSNNMQGIGFNLLKSRQLALI